MSERTELDKLRDAVSDIIQNYFDEWEPHLRYTVDNYDMADEIIELLRPDLARSGEV